MTPLTDSATSAANEPDSGAESAPETSPAAERLRYRLLSGPDDRAFCERVSTALAEGYVLHGSPAATFDGTRVIVAQAVVLDRPAAATVVPA